MNDPVLTKEIFEKLSKANDQNDIILQLCEQYHLTWQEAEARVRQVQEQEKDAITLRQAPILVAIAFVTFIAGLVLLVMGLYPIIFATVTLIQHGSLHNLFRSQDFLLLVNTMVRTGINPFAAIALGIALVLGSQLGMRDVWAAFLEKWKIGP